MSAEQFITDHLDLWTDAVTAKSTSGRGSNGKIELTGIKKLRELILELAVRGKLVPQSPQDEPAPLLLKRIAAERARLLSEARIKKPKETPSISADEQRFDLPENWAWARLGTITQINPRNEGEDESEVSFIPMPLITTAYSGEHGQEQRKWSEIKKGYTHFADGDIALAKITPCFENSKAAVFRDLQNSIGAGTTELHVARPYGSTIDPFFILCCLKSPGFLQRGEQRVTGTAGQKRLPREFFASEPLPLPPLPEQRRIVQKVNELMALCDRLEHQTRDQHAAHETLVDALLDKLTQSKDANELADNWTRFAVHFDTLFTTEHSIDRLKQTVLQLAVMGKLIQQDSKDESAAMLLQRIEMEKARLVKEGQIKKLKKFAACPVEAQPFGVPPGWVWTAMGNVGLTTTGKTPSTKVKEFFIGKIPFVGPGQLAASGEISRSDKC